MNLKNNRGQFVIEAVLLMVLSLGLLSLGLRTLRDGNILGSFISGPWERVAGMIESGSWDPPEVAAKKHPNQINRNLSLSPPK